MEAKLLQATSVAAKKFDAVVRALGAEAHVVWFWAGRERHGRIIVERQGEVLDQEPFSRSTLNWTPADDYVRRMRSGSHKHLAVLALTARLKALPSPAPALS